MLYLWLTLGMVLMFVLGAIGMSIYIIYLIESWYDPVIKCKEGYDSNGKHFREVIRVYFKKHIEDK